MCGGEGGGHIGGGENWCEGGGGRGMTVSEGKAAQRAGAGGHVNIGKVGRTVRGGEVGGAHVRTHKHHHSSNKRRVS